MTVVWLNINMETGELGMVFDTSVTSCDYVFRASKAMTSFLVDKSSEFSCVHLTWVLAIKWSSIHLVLKAVLWSDGRRAPIWQRTPYCWRGMSSNWSVHAIELNRMACLTDKKNTAVYEGEYNPIDACISTCTFKRFWKQSYEVLSLFRWLNDWILL